MKHLFVPYELAMLAKEKGFDEPCFAIYAGRFKVFNIIDSPIVYDASKRKHQEAYPHIITAPLYQQLIDWFREKHSIHVETCYGQLYKEYQFKIGNWRGEHTNNYYEALNKALEEAFKLINIEEVK